MVKSALRAGEGGAPIASPLPTGWTGSRRYPAGARRQRYRLRQYMSYPPNMPRLLRAPFREAVGGSGARLKGDKRTYHIDYFNATSLARVERILGEGRRRGGLVTPVRCPISDQDKKQKEKKKNKNRPPPNDNFNSPSTPTSVLLILYDHFSSSSFFPTSLFSSLNPCPLIILAGANGVLTFSPSMPARLVG